MNSGKKEIRLVNGAEAIAEAKTCQELRRLVAFWYHRFVRKRLNQCMKPDIFMDDFERTEWGDSIYSAIGRLLTLATHFESSCRGLVGILQLKKAPHEILESPAGLKELSDTLWRHSLGRNILILAITKDEDYLSNPAKQGKVKELERQIDQMVYELYELTPDEIAVVEGRSENRNLLFCKDAS